MTSKRVYLRRTSKGTVKAAYKRAEKVINRTTGRASTWIEPDGWRPKSARVRHRCCMRALSLNVSGGNHGHR